jgi:hypothetical protein
MKRFIYLTVVLMIGFMLIGCSGMTAEQRKEEWELRSGVGDSQFVGDSDNYWEAKKAALGIGMR